MKNYKDKNMVKDGRIEHLLVKSKDLREKIKLLTNTRDLVINFFKKNSL